MDSDRFSIRRYASIPRDRAVSSSCMACTLSLFKASVTVMTRLLRQAVSNLLFSPSPFSRQYTYSLSPFLALPLLLPLAPSPSPPPALLHLNCGPNSLRRPRPEAPTQPPCADLCHGSIFSYESDLYPSQILSACLSLRDLWRDQKGMLLGLQLESLLPAMRGSRWRCETRSFTKIPSDI